MPYYEVPLAEQIFVEGEMKERCKKTNRKNVELSSARYCTKYYEVMKRS